MFKKKNKIEETLKKYNQAIQELQNQVKVLQHTLKYGENGIGVEICTKVGLCGLPLKKMQVTYIHENKVCAVFTLIKKEIFEKYIRGTHEIEILLSNLKYIIFNLNINDRGVIWDYTYIVDKETEAISEYPRITDKEDE